MGVVTRPVAVEPICWLVGVQRGAKGARVVPSQLENRLLQRLESKNEILDHPTTTVGAISAKLN